MSEAGLRINIHAGCVAIGGKGVLILGASGAGKSDLALRLIDEGARLVADDRCELFVRAGKLCARAPAAIAGLLEVRGIGIIALPHAKSAGLAMVVRLKSRNRQRLPEPAFYVPQPSPGPHAKVPLILVDAAAASAAPRIRTALRAFSTGGFRDTFNE
jgi:NAD(P)-dependent dehydrogenase (short-subunit alcohol dehydrogenase family)